MLNFKSFRLCNGPDQGFYSGHQVGLMDMTVPQWKTMGSYEMMVDQEVIQAVGGRPLGLDIRVGEIALSVCK